MNNLYKAIPFLLSIVSYNAYADYYSFSETVSGVAVSGTFFGTSTIQDPNVITHISQFSYTAFGDPMTTFSDSSLYYAGPVPGSGPTLSYNGLQNYLIVKSPFFNEASFVSASTFTGYYGAGFQYVADPMWHQINTPGVSGNPTDWKVTNLTSAVPEPETCTMLLAGLGLMGFMARRKSGKKAERNLSGGPSV